MKYFTDNDLNSLVFFQVPKVLIYGEKYKNMKPNTMKLYIVLSDRIKLSMMKGWKEDGKYYVRLSEKTAEKLLGLSRSTFMRCKKELEELGLLEQKQEGLNKTNKLFIGQLDFTEDDVYKVNSEIDDMLEDAEETAKNIDESRKVQNDTSGSSKMKHQEVSKRYSINNDSIKNDLNNNNTNIVNKDLLVNNSFKNSFDNSSKDSCNNSKDEEIIYKLTNEYRNKGLSKEVCLRVVQEAQQKTNVKNFGGYLRTCLEGTLHKSQMKKGKYEPSKNRKQIEATDAVPFYNWLKQ
ncbi:hypothetical protein BIV60_15415 [Bacillus sp. MUM 116]|uniref:replication initiator protein A n=1 Tax=Bacillus sp. MUM 116 TaxID=1678002 RepID=UPI0008F5F14D|nr:replication initiator protein A [Bacillus sp. MUM 116]OIK12911.1 hypothetical protein BIV60_15415 [Bacillus sp. MUM 116]